MNKHGKVFQYLESLRGKWDGVSRVCDLATIGFGTNLDSYGLYLMANAAVRYMEDRTYMPPFVELHGPQGCGKSQALAALAGDFYSNDEAKPATTKRYGHQLVWPEDCLIWEWPEYHEATDHLTRRLFLQRPWFADCPLVVMTANDTSKMFWPGGFTSPCAYTTRTNPEWIREYRDQLWAEILTRISQPITDQIGGSDGQTRVVEPGSQAAGSETVSTSPGDEKSKGLGSEKPASAPLGAPGAVSG